MLLAFVAFGSEFVAARNEQFRQTMRKLELLRNQVKEMSQELADRQEISAGMSQQIMQHEMDKNTQPKIVSGRSVTFTTIAEVHSVDDDSNDRVARESHTDITEICKLLEEIDESL